MPINNTTIEAFLWDDLTKEDKLKKSKDGKSYMKTSVVLANKKSETNSNGTFIYITLFGITAEYVNKYGTKGTRAFISGHLQGNFDKEGKQNGIELIVDNISLMTKSSTSNTETQNDKFDKAVSESVSQGVSDDDLPF